MFSVIRMSEYARPSVPRGWLVGFVALYVVVLGYSLVLAQSLLIPVSIGAVVVVLGVAWLAWRFLIAIESIADSLQRIAQERELER